MGDLAPMQITRIVHEEVTGELQAKDYDFSQESIGEHKEKGYRMAMKALNK
jgi:hypothetical protein